MNKKPQFMRGIIEKKKYFEFKCKSNTGCSDFNCLRSDVKNKLWEHLKVIGFNGDEL